MARRRLRPALWIWRTAEAQLLLLEDVSQRVRSFPDAVARRSGGELRGEDGLGFLVDALGVLAEEGAVTMAAR